MVNQTGSEGPESRHIKINQALISEGDFLSSIQILDISILFTQKKLIRKLGFSSSYQFFGKYAAKLKVRKNRTSANRLVISGKIFYSFQQFFVVMFFSFGIFLTL